MVLWRGVIGAEFSESSDISRFIEGHRARRGIQADKSTDSGWL